MTYVLTERKGGLLVDANIKGKTTLNDFLIIFDND